jgi:hypothetical protein
MIELTVHKSPVAPPRQRKPAGIIMLNVKVPTAFGTVAARAMLVNVVPPDVSTLTLTAPVPSPATTCQVNEFTAPVICFDHIRS